MSATYIKGSDGQTSYINLDMAQRLSTADNGDGTWIIVAQYSDYSIKVLTGATYTSQANANAAIEAHLGLNLISSF